MLTARSYAPSQADVAVFKGVSSAPDAAKYPHAARWYKHIATFESDFATLPGDASKPVTEYGPEASELTVNPAKAPAADDDDDDVDLFGSDDEEEDAEAVRIREERLAEYNKKKAGKVKPAAKSIVTLDVKPWGKQKFWSCKENHVLNNFTDDETNIEEMAANVKAIEQDGLVWGASKFVPVGFGIKKLQINLVIEDDKVSLDDLQAKIEEDEDHVQSTDVVAMQKL